MGQDTQPEAGNAAKTDADTVDPLFRKEQLECEKIKAEIENIRRPFYRTHNFYTAILPLGLAISGLVFSWSSGWFDIQQKKLDAQRISLEFDLKQLEAKKVEQQQHLRALESDRDDLKARLVLLEKQRNELQSLKNSFESQLKTMAGQETNNQTLLRQVLDLQEQVRNLTATNALLMQPKQGPSPGAPYNLRLIPQ